MILDAFENWRCYSSRPAWTRAFAWLAAMAPDIAPGDYPIDGRDIFAAVFEFTSQNLLDADLTAHKIYADIHVPLSAPAGGPEVQARFGLDELAEATPYDEKRDLTYYAVPERLNALFTLTPGHFSAYFPQDAHLTRGKTGAAKEKLRKVVVKIRAELLRP